MKNQQTIVPPGVRAVTRNAMPTRHRIPLSFAFLAAASLVFAGGVTKAAAQTASCDAPVRIATADGWVTARQSGAVLTLSDDAGRTLVVDGPFPELRQTGARQWVVDGRDGPIVFTRLSSTDLRVEYGARSDLIITEPISSECVTPTQVHVWLLWSGGCALVAALVCADEQGTYSSSFWVDPLAGTCHFECANGYSESIDIPGGPIVHLPPLP